MTISPDSTVLCDIMRGIEAGSVEAEEELFRRTGRGVGFLMERQLGADGLEAHVAGALRAVVEAIREGRIPGPERLTGFLRETVNRRIAQELQSRSSILRPFQPQLRQVTSDVAHARATIQAVPESQREILIRYYGQNESREDICASLNLTVEQFEEYRAAARKAFQDDVHPAETRKPAASAASACSSRALFVLDSRKAPLNTSLKSFKRS